VRILKNLPNIKSVASGSFLAFIAGGMTVYEMCAMAIPFIVIPSNLNQMLVAMHHDKIGSGINLGMSQKIDEHKIYDAVYNLMNDGYDELLAMSRIGGSIVGGGGIKLIVDEIERIRS
jgi:spore coat polysaccharide biosynthesis predicted glycosyltransferase SpsG